jgi:hypothetical protein
VPRPTLADLLSEHQQQQQQYSLPPRPHPTPAPDSAQQHMATPAAGAGTRTGRTGLSTPVDSGRAAATPAGTDSVAMGSPVRRSGSSNHADSRAGEGAQEGAGVWLSAVLAGHSATVYAVERDPLLGGVVTADKSG